MLSGKRKEDAVKIKINGKEETLKQGAVSVGELLKIFKVEQPDMVSVQLNGEFVERPDFEKTDIKDGDEVDFLYFMGGGSKIQIKIKNLKK